MEKEGLGNTFMRHLAMAIPWGLVLLIVFFISALGIKQQVKEGIQYAVSESINETANLVFDYNVIVPVKQNIKEGIEFVAKTAREEVKSFIEDPQIKQNIKEALEFTAEKMRKQTNQ